ncbi:bilirubin oxidase [Pseudomonas cavernicola]|uniref:Bilirubin oxidase n=1 Tax=Pseudomonas cavernicola TaxID=2320866 RepID=A0A418X8P5_9PSED|nr:multicopper oxidase domain-containing protein [Pseudomonas cavernicola]RJG08866.1 bilirubin oxidase [Pseudomonas cavernicola]
MKAKLLAHWKGKLQAGSWGISIQANGWKPLSPAPLDEPDGAGRRAFLKLGAAALAVPLLLSARPSASKDGEPETPLPVFPPSPPTKPWQVFLPNAITPLAPVDPLTPPPSVTANIAGGEECGRATHQRYAELLDALGVTPTVYELNAVERPDWEFHPDYPKQPVWVFESDTPDKTQFSPVFFARYGQPILCRVRNRLPQDHTGFGTPEVSVHLHNLHTPSESDGFPGDYFSPDKAGPTLSAPGKWKDHFYPNVYAGYDQQKTRLGDPNEALGTLWFHDHTLDFTAPNTVRGLFGFYLLFDNLDSGDEGPQSSGLRLPSHPYDYTLSFGDRRFDANKRLFFDEFNPEGVLGDKVIVNGKIEPVLRVARRKYRLRLLNIGPSRNYELYLTRAGVVQRFTHIANDGNLLPAPLLYQTRVRIGVAERADIVVDFSSYPLGTELFIVNRLVQDTTRKPGDVVAPGTQLLKIIVDRTAADVSMVPSALRPLPDIPSPAEIAALPVRRWEFDRKNGLWQINQRLVDVKTPRAKIKKGSAEVWELVNDSGGWTHPIHIHFEEGRILSKTVDGVNVPVPLHERGRKDVFVLGPNTTLRVFLRFRDFIGKYVMHCHNMIHEDHAMMLRWDIEDD